jgi:hypothetical protein
MMLILTANVLLFCGAIFLYWRAKKLQKEATSMLEGLEVQGDTASAERLLAVKALRSMKAALDELAGKEAHTHT